MRVSSPSKVTQYVAVCCAAGILAGCTDAADPASRIDISLTGYHFGVTSTNDYENGWQDDFSYINENAEEFRDKFAWNNTLDWYYNLVGGFLYIEETGDAWSGGIDTVHALYISTHGAVNSTYAKLAMWDQEAWVPSVWMRLGDDAAQLGLMIAYSCHLLQFNDGKFPDRWANAFKGGLYYFLGSQDIVHDGWTVSDVGAQVAEDLNNGWNLWAAWHDGASDWWAEQDLTAVATGTNQANCEYRRDNATWPGVMSYTRLRDSAINWYCWRSWYDA